MGKPRGVHTKARSHISGFRNVLGAQRRSRAFYGKCKIKGGSREERAVGNQRTIPNGSAKKSKGIIGKGKYFMETFGQGRSLGEDTGDNERGD